MSFDAGAITSTLGLDISPFGKGMLEANALAAVFPQTVTTFLANPLLGLISIAEKAASAIKSAFVGVASAADNAGEAAEKVGVSVEFLTGIGAVAKDAGSSVEGLGDAMKFLNNNAADAAAGNQTAIKAFGDLGISVTDAAGQLKGGEAIFFEVADAIASLPSEAQKTQAAMNLLGRGGNDMIAVLNQGSAALKEQQAMLMGLGAGFSQAEAQAGDKFGQMLTIIGAAWDGIKKSLAMPIMEFVVENFDQIKTTVIDFATMVKDAIGSVVAPILKAVLPLFLSLAEVVTAVLGPAFKVLGAILQPVVKIFQVIFDLIAKIISGVAGAIGAFARFLGLSAGDQEAVKKTAAEVNGGKGGVKIDQVNINTDGKEASSQIAAKLEQPIRQGMQQQSRDLDRRASSALVAINL